MTSFKSPDDVMREFDTDWLAPEHPQDFKYCDCCSGQESDHDAQVFSASQTRLQREWLRSSLASVLLYAAEQMNGEKKTCTCGDGERCELCPDVYRNRTLKECRAILINEAKKITE